MSTAVFQRNEAGLAVARHVIPFFIWVGVMSIPMSNLALRYAFQTLASLVAFLWLKPWRYYSAIHIQSLPLSVLLGVVVAVVWILPESRLVQQFPDFQGFYVKYCMRGNDSGSGQSYAPEQCGWMFTIIRLGGSALVIAVIEEFFWRGFFMRWMSKLDFLSVDPVKVARWIFIITAVGFGFEHSRWLVGIIAGLAYGWLYCRRGDILNVAVAHGITNFLLGLYVLATSSYQFW